MRLELRSRSPSAPFLSACLHGKYLHHAGVNNQAEILRRMMHLFRSDPITSSKWSYTADRMMLPRCRMVAWIGETFDCNSKEAQVGNPKWIARRGGWGPDSFGDPPGGTAILVSDVQPVVAFGVDRLDVRAQATGAVRSAIIGCPDTAPLFTHPPASSAQRTKAVETPFSHSSLMLNRKPSIVSALEREHRLCRI